MKRLSYYRNDWADFDDDDDPRPQHKRPLFVLAWLFIFATIIYYSFFAK